MMPLLPILCVCGNYNRFAKVATFVCHTDRELQNLLGKECEGRNRATTDYSATFLGGHLAINEN